MSVDDQHRMVLTSHPLQRIGAFAFARLGKLNHPDRVTPEAFEVIASKLSDHAIHAAMVGDTKQPDGFWLKCSLSFFPNAPMNHPSNGKKDDQTVRDAVARWRQMPDRTRWPAAACVLCGRAAAGFFGKRDVPLAESDIYRNTTPRGHEGMALCWPCTCCFYALPYGCQLTGGPAIALHSWDDGFLLRTVARRVSGNGRAIAAGQDSLRPYAAREVLALRALRHYEGALTAGVDLLAFSNNNRGQTLDIQTMEQPLAEWLRRTMTMPERRIGFHELVRAHQTTKVLGVAGLARNAFRDPGRILGACARYLTGPPAGHGRLRRRTRELAALAFSYVREVMTMDEPDLKEITATAGRIAAKLSAEEAGGKLRQFFSYSKNQRRLRGWLQQEAVDWALDPPGGETEPLLTTHGFALLFDPDENRQVWFNRQLLLIAVLEDLHRRGWRPVDGQQEAERLREEAADTLEREEQEQLAEDDDDKE